MNEKTVLIITSVISFFCGILLSGIICCGVYILRLRSDRPEDSNLRDELISSKDTIDGVTERIESSQSQITSVSERIRECYNLTTDSLTAAATITDTTARLREEVKVLANFRTGVGNILSSSNNSNTDNNKTDGEN